jgi:outer membrane lipoprotein-sorting protein
MRKALPILLLSLCSQNVPVKAQNDPKAKSILDAVSKKVNSLNSLKANFTLNLTGGKGGKVTDSKKGSVSLKGQKYHVLLSGQEIICDTKTVWTYNKDTKEVNVSNYNPDEQTISPAKLFTNFYDKEYNYSYKGERKEQGKNCEVIELLPLDSKKKFTKIELMVDKAASIIVGGNIWEKNGNKYQYSISNFTPNPNIPDNFFTWDAKEHAGVEVVDLR